MAVRLMTGGQALGDIDEALAEAEAERREEAARAAAVAAAPPVPAAAPAPVKKLGRPRKVDAPAATAVVSDDQAVRFIQVVRLYLKATAVRRADRTLFDDRCLACERRGVHGKDRWRCDCYCHELRKLLPPE